jgi:hypothetical protein
MSTPRNQAGLTKIWVKAWLLIASLSAPLWMLSLTGCATDRYNPGLFRRIEGNRTAEPGYTQTTDQRIEDRRTAERVREALAACADYRYDGVRVVACNGVVELSGFVNTGAQSNRAREVAGTVAGVKGVENKLTVRD